jgi:molybdopterin/thiamine biosynthesis adenylyltransferase
MKVEAEIPRLKKITIDVDEESTVGQLKKKLCEELSLEHSLTTILHGGKPIPEGEQLKNLPEGKLKFELDYLWSRQTLIWGLEGQKLLREAKVFIAGAGALGNETAKNLALMGVGRITIADHDTVETSNLSRCVFFDRNDVGGFKASTLAHKLEKKFPYVEFKAYNMRVEEVPDEEILTSNVLISGLDNLASRAYMTSLANRYNIPLVDGGMAGNLCRIQSFTPGQSPCPICMIPVLDYGQLTGLRNPCSAPLEEATTPSLMTATSLVSAVQSSEAVKLILMGDKNLREKLSLHPLEGVLIIDLQFNRFSLMPLKKNPNCFICGVRGIAKDHVRVFELNFNGQPVPYRLLIEKIKEILETVEEPHLYERKNGGYINLVKNQIRGEERINTGSYIHVIFKNKSDQYKEAIIKLM